MTTETLDGTWQLQDITAGTKAITARVPGCVHTDLLRAGVIPDPYVSDNEARLHWIGEHEWRVSRSFTVSEEFLAEKNVLLECLGVDTFSTISINGVEIGTTDNQFRRYRFDVRKVLAPGKNTIEVVLHSPFPEIKRMERQRFLAITGDNHHRLRGNNQIRKSQCNFGWDWGPICVTAGIWRPLRLVAYSGARLDDVLVHQTVDDRRAELTVDVGLQWDGASALGGAGGGASGPQVHLELRDEEDLVAEGTADSPSSVPNGEYADEWRRGTLTVDNPKLWWPADLGEQPLYRLDYVLVGADGSELERASRQIGIRELRLVREADEAGESFAFEANGYRVYAKGANWIPADTFTSRVGAHQYEQLLRDARDTGMNMLRVWGGGIYEDDLFYQLCDELGICVWQDFMFACSAYPAYDAAFMENVAAEARDNVARLQHHASLALWCGNNEIEQIPGFIGNDRERGQMSWAEYSSLFDELLPSITKLFDPNRPYWPSSEHSPHGDRTDSQNPRWGDAHLWGVWHGREPFEWYRTCAHRFVSEFGFQSFPEPQAIDLFAHESERNISSYTMEWHQRSGIGNDAIIQYMLGWFRLPADEEMVIWLSQVLQGLAMKYAIEHWRRALPHTMGTLYWQLNDCWPAASWASIDWQGRWKALQYFAARFFASPLLSAVEDVEARSVSVQLTNDTYTAGRGTARCQAFSLSGELLDSVETECDVPEFGTTTPISMDASALVEQYGTRGLIFRVSFTEANGAYGRDNWALFSRPKHLPLEQPNITTEVHAEGDELHVTLESDKPALWTWLSIEDRWLSEFESAAEAANPAAEEGSSGGANTTGSSTAGDFAGTADGGAAGGSGTAEGSAAGGDAAATAEAASSGFAAQPRFSDNFFHLFPGIPVTVRVLNLDRATANDLDSFARKLHVRSLRDTYR